MKSILVPLLLLVASTAFAEEKRPNIVFIMADDHCRQASSCYGGNLIQTPGMDRIAREGIRFTRAMVPNSICSPSRATLLTGKHSHKSGVKRLDDVFDGSQQTFPKLLQQAGYQTALIGKWHLASEPTGFDHYAVLPGQGQYHNSPFKMAGKPWKSPPVAVPGYVTDVITDLSLEWLDQRDPDKPFCIMIHHKAPHSLHHPAERHKDLFKDTALPEPPNLLDNWAGRAPGAVDNKQIWSALLYNDYPQYQAIKKQFNGDRAHDLRLMYQEYVKGYLRLVVAMDENIQRVMDYLEDRKLLENTVVIYTSDNGFFLGEHGYYNKQWMYEESLRIPLLVRMPKSFQGLPAGSTQDSMVGIQDFAPTLLDLAGRPVPAEIQGRSFLPLLKGDTAGERKEFYYHYYGWQPYPGNMIADHEVIGITTKEEKLILYPGWLDAGKPFWEYFDLTTDPRDMNNFHASPAHQDKVRAMTVRLRALAAEYGDQDVVKLLDRLATPSPATTP